MWMILLLVSILFSPGAMAIGRVAPVPSCFLHPNRFNGVDSLRSPLVELVGRYSGSGGGSGKACFHTRSEALAAADENWILGQKQRHQASHFWLLDVFEMNDRNDFFPTEGRSPREYLNWVLDKKWKPFAPTLVKAVKEELAGLDRAKKVDFGDLPLLEDQGPFARNKPSFDLESGEWCDPVQLAIRRQVHRSNGRPELELDYDRDLLSRLGDPKVPDSRTWNQAAFWLHEAISTDAMELGQEDTLRAREFVRRLLSKSYYESFLKLDAAGRAQFIESMMESIRFQNLAVLYPGEKDEKKDGNGPYSKVTRQKSFESLQNKIKKMFKSWLAGRDPLATYLRMAHDPELMKSFLNFEVKTLYPKLSDEEAFLIHALGLPMIGIKDDSGHILDSFRIIKSGEDDEALLTEYCRKLIPGEERRFHQPGDANFEKLRPIYARNFEAVDRYCRAIGR